ncbi:hypothetical protein SAMN06295967_103135 [Belliella buryatensis]|uniref:Uncharacterized protein n=1 Tax=Belliella buryatensis TaxID=1500549 RepID=A0A239BQR4_9BACT|nr:hypothetical protein [Belliella buryatensis]SNS09483.1 hypothetical protein SAMN06295967_103135 [Belliella buryatensis]
MHPDRKNIDRNVNLPQGINFREDVIWGQIKRPKKNKKPVFWWVAASVVLIVSIGLFLFSNSVNFEEDLLLTTTSQHEIGFLPIPEIQKVEADEIVKKTKLSQESNIPQSNPKPSILKVENAENKEADRFIADTEEIEKEIPQKTQVVEPKPVETQLSPAAQRLQASLDKVNPKSKFKEKIILQRMTLAEFLGANRNLDLAKGKNINQESVLSTLIRGNYEKN